jgi:membrane-bound lytic murein transglycosylase MltF
MRCAFLFVALLAACSPDAPKEVLAAPAETERPEPAPVPPAAITDLAQTEPAPDLLAANIEVAQPEPALLLRVTQPDTSDWPEIERRGVLRVLVAPDRTNFFVAEGRLRGLEYELVHQLEQELAKSRAGVRPGVDVAFVPVAFDRLLPALLEGRGDVAVAGLTITPEREASVAFTQPYLSDVSEIIVAHAGVACPESLDGLSGRTFCLAPGTSYVGSVARLNADLAARGLAPVRVQMLVPGLTTEDALELVHAGAFDYTVADRHVAELWAGVLDGLRPAPQLALSKGRSLAWAVRRDNPELKARLDVFVAGNKKGTLTGNVLFKRYFGATRWIRDPTSDLGDSKLGPFLEPLQRLSAQYGFDWRLIAAQAYQESQLNPDARSRSGARGLMQLMPATAKDMGFDDVSSPEDNLHAGIKYMAWLRDTYFDAPELPEPVRVDLALAAYNAGPGRVRRWRSEAPERGADPNRWFGEIENVALEDVGLEPVRYVANVNKYFVILARLLDESAVREEGLRGTVRER